MEKWYTCLELLHFLRGYNAAILPNARIPQQYIDALASVLGDVTPEDKDPYWNLMDTPLGKRVTGLEEQVDKILFILSENRPLTAHEQWLPSASDQERE